MSVKRGRGNPTWEKSKSANPGGRRKIPPEIQEAYERLLKKTLKRIEKEVDADNVTLQGLVAALKECGDRTLGKVPQRTELTGEDGTPLFEPTSARETLVQKLREIDQQSKELH